MEKIFIAADHAGYSRKEEIKQLLKAKKIEFEDMGPIELEPADDYPNYGKKVAEAVAAGKGIGILICDTGIGMDMVANKLKGVRASLATNVFMAKRGKEHNNANVLVLSAEINDWTSTEQIVMTWLLTPFSDEERHRRRLEKIESIEPPNA